MLQIAPIQTHFVALDISSTTTTTKAITTRKLLSTLVEKIFLKLSNLNSELKCRDLSMNEKGKGKR